MVCQKEFICRIHNVRVRFFLACGRTNETTGGIEKMESSLYTESKDIA